MITIYAMDIMTLDPDLEVYRQAIPRGRLDHICSLPGRAHLLSLAAELLFQRSVRRHCRGVPTPVERDVLPNGKPYLLGRPDFHFNLSHSGVWAVCAVADVEVGVDIQQYRGVSGKLVRRFTNAEQQMLDSVEGEEKMRLLFEIWVRKEAFLKCTGEGLTRSTRSFEAMDPGGGYVTQMVDFPVPGYQLGVCTREEEAEEAQLIIMPF